MWWYKTKYHLEGEAVQDRLISGGKDKLERVGSPSSRCNPSCTYTPSVACPTLFENSFYHLYLFNALVSNLGLPYSED